MHAFLNGEPGETIRTRQSCEDLMLTCSPSDFDTKLSVGGKRARDTSDSPDDKRARIFGECDIVESGRGVII